MKIILIILLLISSYKSVSQISKNNIDEIITNNPKLIFRENNYYLANFVLKNTSYITYQKSLKFKDKEFYILYSYIENVYDYQKNNQFVTKDSLGNVLEPYKAVFQHLAFNICSDEFFDYSEFDTLSVRKEFNAKWGASSQFRLKKDTFLDMKYCTIVAVYNGNNNMLITYYLSKDDKAKIEDLNKVFYDVIFKPN